MSYYIIISRLNGRNDFYRLAQRLDACGYEDTIEYFEGGWSDSSMNRIPSHLKFENEADAVAYSLTYGGDVTRTSPGTEVVESPDNRVGHI
jgi:hypothetical protein